MNAAAHRLLGGVRVLDLTRLLPGGFCSRILADFGADVIKVEDAAAPDGMRHGTELSLVVDGVPVLFSALHRGKRALAVNLKDPLGKAAFLRLAKTADVLLEGFRPGVMARLGLSYEELHARIPHLVYCSLSGYGQQGPYSGRAGHDLNYQAIAGTLYLGIEPDVPPALPDLPWADLAGGGMMAAMGVLAGLFAARASRRGGHIDAAMVDGLLLLGMRPMMEALLREKEPVRSENLGLGAAACYNIYRTKDGGFMTVATLEPKFWKALCELLNRPDLVAIQWDRGKQEQIKTDLARIFATKTRDEWTRLAAQSDCCLEPVLGPGEAHRHPQIAMRQHLYPLRQADGRTSLVPGVPAGLTGNSSGISPPDAPAQHQEVPLWGQHSREVLLEAGLSEAEVAALAGAGVIRTSEQPAVQRPSSSARPSRERG